MTGDSSAARGLGARLAALPPRRELTVVLILGVVGTGLIFLAMRQSWAQIRTAVPPPLPASVVRVSGQSLVPYADALAIAALASLAAVLATRRVARRAVGVLLAGLGAALGVAAGTGVTAAAARAAVTASLGPPAGAAAGTSAGSVTEGTSRGGSAVPDVTGFHAHVTLTAGPWQAVSILGALVIIAVGVLVTWRADRLPVMSGRYDSPAGGSSPARAEPPGTPASRPDSASVWESLSRGEDPTSAPDSTPAGRSAGGAAGAA